MILGKVGLSVIKSDELKRINLYLEAVSTPDNKKRTDSASGIVFSMDRALQLHALLSSYLEQVEKPAPLHLFYKTSNAMHQKAYDEIIEMFSGKLASVSVQKPFRGKLIELLEAVESSKMFYLVDDDVFIDKIDMMDYAGYDTRYFIPSMRLGLNLKRNYTYGREQALPRWVNFPQGGKDRSFWRWREGELDWAVPCSIDGNLLDTKEILHLSRIIPYQAPNTYESALLAYAKWFGYRYGVCYSKSKIVNIPCNMVQTEIANIHGSLHQDALLERWQKGLQIDYRALYGVVNESAHQDVPFNFIKRAN